MCAFKVIAIGGGGCTSGSDPELDELVVLVAGKPRLRCGFVGAASNDDWQKFQGFRAAFERQGCLTSRVELGGSPTSFGDWIAAQDIIYVGGGNTVRLLTWWRQSGFAEVFKATARSDTVLAGVSAGAVCWWEWALTDSLGEGLQPIAGLGLVTGSCCPHYSSEPDRREAFAAAIDSGQLPPGIAIDDGVAVVVGTNLDVSMVSTRDGCAAYSVSHHAGEFTARKLPHFRASPVGTTHR